MDASFSINTRVLHANGRFGTVTGWGRDSSADVTFDGDGDVPTRNVPFADLRPVALIRVGWTGVEAVAATRGGDGARLGRFATLRECLDRFGNPKWAYVVHDRLFRDEFFLVEHAHRPGASGVTLVPLAGRPAPAPGEPR